MMDTQLHLRLRCDRGGGTITDKVFYNGTGLVMHYEDRNGRKRHYHLLGFKREWDNDLKKWILQIFFNEGDDKYKLIREIKL